MGDGGVCEKTDEKKQAATSVAARFLYMVVLYMAAGVEKCVVAQRNGLYFTLSAFAACFYSDLG
jgi:hypothetical protein